MKIIHIKQSSLIYLREINITACTKWSIVKLIAYAA